MSIIGDIAICLMLWFVWRQLESIALSLMALRNIAEQNHRSKYGEESQKA